jgi:hypothetical protein
MKLTEVYITEKKEMENNLNYTLICKYFSCYQTVSEAPFHSDQYLISYECRTIFHDAKHGAFYILPPDLGRAVYEDVIEATRDQLHKLCHGLGH